MTLLGQGKNRQIQVPSSPEQKKPKEGDGCTGLDKNKKTRVPYRVLHTIDLIKTYPSSSFYLY